MLTSDVGCRYNAPHKSIGYYIRKQRGCNWEKMGKRTRIREEEEREMVKRESDEKIEKNRRKTRCIWEVKKKSEKSKKDRR